MEDQHPGIAVAYRPALKLYAVRALQAHRLGRWLGGPQRSVTLSCRHRTHPRILSPASEAPPPHPTSAMRHTPRTSVKTAGRAIRAARKFTRGLLFVSLSTVTRSSSDGWTAAVHLT